MNKHPILFKELTDIVTAHSNDPSKLFIVQPRLKEMRNRNDTSYGLHPANVEAKILSAIKTQPCGGKRVGNGFYTVVIEYTSEREEGEEGEAIKVGVKEIFGSMTFPPAQYAPESKVGEIVMTHIESVGLELMACDAADKSPLVIGKQYELGQLSSTQELKKALNALIRAQDDLLNFERNYDRFLRSMFS